MTTGGKTAMEEEQLLTVAQVAKHLNSSEKFVRAEIRRQRLGAIDLGRGYRVSPKDLAEYISLRQTKNSGDLVEV